MRLISEVSSSFQSQAFTSLSAPKKAIVARSLNLGIPHFLSQVIGLFLFSSPVESRKKLDQAFQNQARAPEPKPWLVPPLLRMSGSKSSMIINGDLGKWPYELSKKPVGFGANWARAFGLHNVGPALSPGLRARALACSSCGWIQQVYLHLIL